jgi:hypothetical protein
MPGYRTASATTCVRLGLLVLAAACDEATGPSFEDPVSITLEPVVQGLDAPVFLTAPRDDGERLFVVEQGGLIRIVRNGTIESPAFLNVSSRIASGGERGLLGLAFHPDYATNGHFYVNYTDTLGHTQVVRYTVSADPDVADQASALPVLTVQQPYTNHNGGMIAFGPDGMLYVGMGDGGSGGDPQGHGQNRLTLLGDMLRLDVDGGTPYAIPADNPFRGSLSIANEIWASGLRNPWRFSFDAQTGDLYIGDVGQNAWEEISFQPASSSGGENYGWAEMEGAHCYPPSTSCSTSGLTLPVHEYDHGDGCAVTGGYVYRGNDAPTLRGRYFFADACAPWLRSFVVVNGEAMALQDHTGTAGPLSSAVSFGEDGERELYVVSHDGSIQRIVSP